MADVKIPEYQIQFVTVIEDNDVVRIILSNNSSRNILKSDFFAGFAKTSDLSDFLTDTEIANLYVAKANYEPFNGSVSEITQESNIAFVALIDTNGIGVKMAYSTFKSLMASSTQWGDITGTLSNQTDLNNALNAKANKNLSSLIFEPNELHLDYIFTTPNNNDYELSFHLRSKNNSADDVPTPDLYPVIVKWARINIYKLDKVNGDSLVGRALINSSDFTISGSFTKIPGLQIDNNFTNESYISVSTGEITISQQGDYRVDINITVLIDKDNIDFTTWDNKFKYYSLYIFAGGVQAVGKSRTLYVTKDIDIS
jgi:hypothetical protein